MHDLKVEFNFIFSILLINVGLTLDVQADHKYTLDPNATDKTFECDQSTRFK